MAADRRVVFASIEDAQIVRYQRAKKWFIEATGDGPSKHSPLPERVTVERAADIARLWARSYDGWVYPGLPGGKQFDRLINQ